MELQSAFINFRYDNKDNVENESIYSFKKQTNKYQIYNEQMKQANIKIVNTT